MSGCQGREATGGGDQRPTCQAEILDAQEDERYG